jgi:Bacterial aa3 type cytochrome c oxidase subunit IV
MAPNRLRRIDRTRSLRYSTCQFLSTNIRGIAMAHSDHSAGSAMDYAEHERTYAMFLGLVKWGSVFVVALLIGMAIFLI